MRVFFIFLLSLAAHWCFCFLPSRSFIHRSRFPTSLSFSLSFFFAFLVTSHLISNSLTFHPCVSFHGFPLLPHTHTLDPCSLAFRHFPPISLTNLCARIPLNLVVHNCIRSIQSIQSHPIPSTHLYDMILVYVSSPLYLVPFHPFSIGYYIWYLGCICITCFPVFHNLYRLM